MIHKVEIMKKICMMLKRFGQAERAHMNDIAFRPILDNVVFVGIFPCCLV